MIGPDPNSIHPVPDHPRIVFLRPLVTRPNIEVGAYTYYDDPVDPLAFEHRNVTHHYEFLGDRLVIGRFCAIAAGATFVMNGANHLLDGISTFPFNIFGGGWENSFDPAAIRAGSKGDTVVGHDVWVGEGATIMPGVTVGSGAIVAARSVVTRDIPPYALAAGNPARVRRMRRGEGEIARLLSIAWWDWPAERIARNLAAIRNGDLSQLETSR